MTELPIWVAIAVLLMAVVLTVLARRAFTTFQPALLRVLFGDEVPPVLRRLTVIPPLPVVLVPVVVLVLAAIFVIYSAGPANVDELGTARACAPAGWTADNFPYGSSDYGLGPTSDIGQIRLLTPASVESGDGLSSPGGAIFITDWWKVSPHEELAVTLSDGRLAKQYRSRSMPVRITTEFATPSGTWHLYGSSEEHYDDVVRCIERRLNAEEHS